MGRIPVSQPRPMPMSHPYRRLLTTAFAACLTAAAVLPTGGHAGEHGIRLADVDRAIVLIGAMGDYFRGLAGGEDAPQLAADWTRLARNYRELDQGLTALMGEGRLQIADLAPERETHVTDGILFFDARLGGTLPAQVEVPAGTVAAAVIAGLTKSRRYDDWSWFVSHLGRAGFAEGFRQNPRAFARALARRDPNGLGPIFVQLWFLQDHYLWAALQLGDAVDEAARHRWAEQKFRAAANMQAFLAGTAPNMNQEWRKLLVADWYSFRATVAGLAGTSRRMATAETAAPAGVAVHDGAQEAPAQGTDGQRADGIDRLIAMLETLQANQDRLVATIVSQQAQIEQLGAARGGTARPMSLFQNAPAVSIAERDRLHRDVTVLLDEIEAERDRTGTFAAGVSQLKLFTGIGKFDVPAPPAPLGDGGAGTKLSAEGKFGDAAMPGGSLDADAITWRTALLMIGLAAAAIALITFLTRAPRPGRIGADHVPEVRELLAIAGPALGQARAAAAHDNLTLAPDFLGKVIRQFSLFERRRWAENLAGRRNAARDLVAALANDELEVARALLLNSTALGDGELIDIVRHRSEDHGMHVALRRPVSAAVADALVATGKRRVILALLENDAARISDGAMERIVEDSQHVESYRQPILRRSNLAPRLAQRLRGWAKSGIRRPNPEHQAPAVTSDDDGLILADVINLDYAEAAAGDTLTPAPVTAPAAAPPTAAVTPQLIVDALRQGQVGLFERLFGEITGLSAERITRVLSDNGGEDLAIACRALGLEKLLFASIFILSRKLADGGKVADPRTLSRILRRFEGISEQAAAVTMSRWREDGAASDMRAA